MIARADIPWFGPLAGRCGRRHRLRPAAAPQTPTPQATAALWARFWNDRHAVRFKVLLLGLVILLGALLEVPR